MIYISVKEGYDKYILKGVLECIKSNAPRELTYDVMMSEYTDVVVDIDSPIRERTLILLSTASLKDDLCIIIGEEYCKAYVNGESVIMHKYVEEMK